MGDKKTVSKVKNIKLEGKLLEWWEQKEDQGNISHHFRQALQLYIVYIESQKEQQEEYLSFLFEDSSNENKNNNTNMNKKRLEIKQTNNINDNIDENIKLEKEKIEEEVDLEELNENLDSF